MKNVTKNLGILALVLVMAGTATMANNGKNTDPVSPSSIVLKFIGNVENQPVFELNLANADADEFFIIIRDENGSLLYSTKAKGANIVRKFMLNEEMGDTNLYVEVKSKKTNKSETYKISKSYSYKEEPVIARAR